MENELHEHVHQTHTLTEQQMHSSRIEFDSLPENITTELITDNAIEQNAQSIHHSIYPRHEVNASQTGNEIGAIDMQECKSHAVIDTLQPLNVTEANSNESIVPIKIDKMPNVMHILPSITTKQSLTNDETLANDTCVDLRVAKHARSATAQFEYVAVKAKMIDERYVQENESEWTNKMPSLQRERADVSIESLHPIEVQLRNAEEIVSDLPEDVPVKLASIDFDVSDEKSLNVIEIVCEQETSPFRSERLAASATAVADFELHRPYNVQETQSSENENTIPLLVVANEIQARVNVTCMDSVAIDQTIANEHEGDFVVSEPESAKADNLLKPYQTMQTNVIDHYEATDSLEDFKYELSRAEIEMNDHNVKCTEMTNVYQSEKELKTKRRPDQKHATATFVTLKSSVTEQLVPNESETELKLDSANVEHATRATAPVNVLEISSDQPLESIANKINDPIAYEKQTAKIDFELLKSAMTNALVYLNEKETDLIRQDLQVQPIVRHDIVENNPIESCIAESLDCERVIETEQAQLRQSKIVSGHTLSLGAVDVIEPYDAIDSVPECIETIKKAKIIVDNVYGVSAYFVHPTEQSTDGIDDAKANFKIASPNLLCQNAIEISTQSTEETFSEMEIDLGENKKQRIPLKPSEALLRSASIFEPYSLENVGDVGELDLRKKFKIADTQFDEHNQVNVTQTTVSEQILTDASIAVQPSPAQATSQFTHQTAASVSVVLPSDSTFDVTYTRPELIKSQFSFDTNPPLCIHEEMYQEAIDQMHAKDETKQYRPSSSFVHQIANEQMEIELLENPVILDLKKAEKCLGKASVNNALVAPEVSNILIHGSENVFDSQASKPIALAKVSADSLNAFETFECVVFDSSNTLRRKESRIDERASSAAMQEIHSHTVYIHNVFEKESALEGADKFEPGKVDLALESPLKPANVTENVHLFSVEQLPSEQSQLIAPIKTQSTKKHMRSAAEETTIIFESENYREVDACENVNIATVNVKPHHYVTIETNEINDSAMQLVPNYASNESICHTTNEPCLAVTINETIIAGEMPTDRTQMRDQFETANLKVNEAHKFDTFETIANIDCCIPNVSAIIRSERELHCLEIIEKSHLEKEIHFISGVNDKSSHRATIVNHTTQHLIKPIQTYQEKINIHIENEYHKEQTERSIGIHAIVEGKLVCISI